MIEMIGERIGDRIGERIGPRKGVATTPGVTVGATASGTAVTAIEDRGREMTYASTTLRWISSVSCLMP